LLKKHSLLDQMILKCPAMFRDDLGWVRGRLVVARRWLHFRPEKKCNGEGQPRLFKIWVPEIRGIMAQRTGRTRGKVVVIGDAGLYAWELDTFALARQVRRSIITACQMPARSKKRGLS
jgi:hypothetical protein